MMKFTKKAVAVLCALMTFALCPAFAAFAEGEKEESMKPIYAQSIQNGTYDIEVQSSASMFKVVACELTVSDNDMSAVMTLSGKGYEKLYMGTGEQAAAVSDSDCIFFVENAEGKYTYRVPVKALNADIDCAAFSFRKQQWYDRTLVFEADSLPESAFLQEETAMNGTLKWILIGCGVYVGIIILTVAFLFTRRKSKEEQERDLKALEDESISNDSSR